MIKLEVGKTYRTNNEWMVKCIYVNIVTANCLCIVSNSEMTIWYTFNGVTLSPRWGTKYDIIAEWHEPQYGWMNVYEREDGILYGAGSYNSQSQADKYKVSNRVSCIKVELKRGVWDE